MAISTPKLLKIELNGVDVSSYLYKGSISKSNNQPVKYGSVRFSKKINDAIAISDLIIGKTFTVQRGFSSSTERYIFRGEVVSYKLVGSVYEFYVACKMYAATRLQMDYTYNINTDTEAGVGSEIAKDLFTEAGLSYSSTSVVSTSSNTALLLNIYPAQGAILDSLKDLSSVYNYTFYYKDSDNYAYFTPKLYNLSSTTLTTGVDIVNRIQWNNTGEDLANNVTMIGGQQLDWATESFAGPATEVTLTAIPVDTDVTVGGVKKQRGINSSDPKDFYVEPDSKKLIFTVSSSTIVVNYSYNVPVKVNVSNYESITNYVQYDKIVVNNKLFNTDDAELKATNYVDESSEVLTSAPLLVIGNNDLELGQVITIVDEVNNKTVVSAINSIEYSLPYTYDKISIGKVPSNMDDWIVSSANNVLKLQRQLASDTDVNVQLINTPSNIAVLGYTKVEESASAPEGLYYDSATQGLYDSGFYYDGGGGTAENYRISSLIPINQTVFEDFYTTEFKGANTTATWTAALGRCTFTSGQTAESTYYLKDLGTNYTHMTLTASYSGTLTLTTSGNGTTWESVTSGAEKAMASSFNYLYWRAVESGASTATLNSVKITYR